jgi:hypothetical protein
LFESSTTGNRRWYPVAHNPSEPKPSARVTFLGRIFRLGLLFGRGGGGFETGRRTAEIALSADDWLASMA